MVLGVKGTYDGFDRTTGIKIGDVTTSFDYNTDSDRVSKTTNGKTTESILDNGSVSADFCSDFCSGFDFYFGSAGCDSDCSDYDPF